VQDVCDHAIALSGARPSGEQDVGTVQSSSYIRQKLSFGPLNRRMLDGWKNDCSKMLTWTWQTSRLGNMQCYYST